MTKRLADKQWFDDESSPVSKKPKIFSSSQDSLVSYETQLLTSGRFSDVTVETTTKQYQLHRVFLARSPYFNTLFTGTWGDNKEAIDLKHVEKELCPQVDEAVWDALFHYIYTDALPGSDSKKLNLAQIELLIELLEFFDLPADPVMATLDPFDTVLIHYRRGTLPTDDYSDVNSPFREMILNLISDVQFPDKMEFVTDGFMEKLIAIPLIPLNTKALWLHQWIQHNLNIQINRNCSWRDMNHAAKYVQMVDSLKFNWVEELDKDVLLNTNILSPEAIQRIMYQDKKIDEIPDEFVINSFYLDDMEDGEPYQCGPTILSQVRSDGYSDTTSLSIKNKSINLAVSVIVSTRCTEIEGDRVTKKWQTDQQIFPPGRCFTVNRHSIERDLEVVLTITKVVNVARNFYPRLLNSLPVDSQFEYQPDSLGTLPPMQLQPFTNTTLPNQYTHFSQLSQMGQFTNPTLSMYPPQQNSNQLHTNQQYHQQPSFDLSQYHYRSDCK